MRIVIAVGGNALLRRGEPPDAALQLQHITAAAQPLGDLSRDHDVVIVHGNGPQVGLLALENASDRTLSLPYPLSDLVAETQGLIGYWLQQALSRRPHPGVVSLVTQTVVDADDPAFSTPTKFIGATYTRGEAEALQEQQGWTFSADGHGWRRVVPSPRPQRVVETEVAEMLLRQGVTVVLAGGGGVPVLEGPDGLRGVDAVVDKDLVAAHLAARLDADLLLILTDVPTVMAHFGTPGQRPLHHVTVEQLGALTFAAGSMAPKVEAAMTFVRSSGKRAAIGALDEIVAVLSGTAGTHVGP